MNTDDLRLPGTNENQRRPIQVASVFIWFDPASSDFLFCFG